MREVKYSPTLRCGGGVGGRRNIYNHTQRCSLCKVRGTRYSAMQLNITCTYVLTCKAVMMLFACACIQR